MSASSPSFFSRAARALRPSYQHSAFSATLLLMSAVMLSRVIGYVREAYIAWAFGAGTQTDAYVAAFTLPDWLNYILAGGTASITFISIYTRYTSQGRNEEARKTFSAIITIITAVLVMLIALAEIYTTAFTRWYFRGFTEDQVILCSQLTRILLPAQIFFYVGGVVSAVLLSRRLFLLPAFGPLLYNVFIILGGVVGARHYGISSLAVGALVGAFAGPFLVNAIGAAKTDIGFRLNFDFRDHGFREWIRLSIPLMLGVSLVTADDWILRFFASHGAGDITRLNYAKRLFAVPIAVLGQATGQASLPFFARLFGEGKREEFARLVNESVYKLVAASLLVSAWMMAAALPIIDLVYRRGRFHFHDSQETAVYFFWFALSLVLWSAQALYARAFYAAGNTLTPMVASTLITIATIPIYSVLYHQRGVVGLAMASDVGILMNTLVMVILLDRSRLVRIVDLNWSELLKALITAAIAGTAGWYAAGWYATHFISKVMSRRDDLMSLAIATIVWAILTLIGLKLTRSELPRALRRKKVAAEAPANIAEQATDGVEP
jgi:putative peptidoglycan lipid II flippase